MGGGEHDENAEGEKPQNMAGVWGVARRGGTSKTRATKNSSFAKVGGKITDVLSEGEEGGSPEQ